LTARAAVWTKKREYARALADLDLAISIDRSNVQTYYARAGVHEARGKPDLALADFSKAIELRPRTIFDMTAQNDARKRVQALEKQIPCGNSASVSPGQTCL
jgi:tetratricopeptide (TPR) repeat protein